MLQVESVESRDTVSFAIALTEARGFQRIASQHPSGPLEACLSALQWPERSSDGAGGGRAVSRVHFGNEFCERLIPSRTQVAELSEAAAGAGVAFTLATPMVSDRGLKSLRGLLERLQEGTEVVVNDWGVLRLMRDGFPRLTPVAGRMLSKMIKDPRIPPPAHEEINAHGLENPAVLALLQQFGVTRLEQDLPPHARLGDFPPLEIGRTVHALRGYATMGRVCKTGSMNLPKEKKFAPGHSCRKECLDYTGSMVRKHPGQAHDLETYHRGNTIFYNHSPAMGETLAHMIENGLTDRIVIAGDWHEDTGAPGQG